MEDFYQAIERRYGLRLPDLYRLLRERGHLTWHGPHSSPDYLFLTDLEWLPLEEIAAYQFFGNRIDGLVPFAISARRDEWCWRRDWQTGGEPAVVLCEWGDTGYGYAPDFQGFLYRALLEEFSGTWLVETFGMEGTVRQFRKYVDWIGPLLPEAWAERLRALAGRELVREPDGTVRLFPRAECDRVIAEDLAFPHLNEQFIHDTDSPSYPGRRR